MTRRCATSGCRGLFRFGHFFPPSPFSPRFVRFLSPPFFSSLSPFLFIRPTGGMRQHTDEKIRGGHDDNDDDMYTPARRTARRKKRARICETDGNEYPYNPPGEDNDVRKSTPPSVWASRSAQFGAGAAAMARPSSRTQCTHTGDACLHAGGGYLHLDCKYDSSRAAHAVFDRRHRSRHRHCRRLPSLSGGLGTFIRLGLRANTLRL